MMQQYRSGPQGSWEQPRQHDPAPQQNPHRRPLAPVGPRGPQQVRGATQPQPFPRQPSQPPSPMVPTGGPSILAAAPPERSLRACGDGDSGRVEGAASTGRSGQQVQDAGVPTDTPSLTRTLRIASFNTTMSRRPKCTRCSLWVRP
jgi:hypothetical protein